MSDPSVLLLSEDEVKSYVAQKIAGREHWIFIIGPGHSPTEIESTYYGDEESSADFELMLGSPNGVFMSFAFAHKRRMSPAELAPLLKQLADAGGVAGMIPSEETLKDHDILFLGEFKDGIALAAVFYAWIKDEMKKFEPKRKAKDPRP